MEKVAQHEFTIDGGVFLQMLEQLQYGVLILDNDRIIFSNNTIAEILGIANKNDLLNKLINNYLYLNSFDYFNTWMKEIQSHSTTKKSHRTELVLTKHNQTPVNVAVIGNYFSQNNKILFQLLITDITNRKQVETELDFYTQYDKGSKSFNHELLVKQVSNKINELLQKNTMLGIMWIDLDHLGSIKESHGRRINDIIMQSAAERLKNAIGVENSIFNTGGDEFVVILQDIKNFNEISTTAKKILAMLSRVYTIDNYDINTPIRAGISVFPDHGTDSQALIKNVLLALKQSKKEGKTCYQFFTPAMAYHLKVQTDLLFQLKNAVLANEFIFLYQPIIDSRTREIVCLEALLRWQRTPDELLLPSFFLSIAEESGIIFQLGEHAIETACKLNFSWLQQGFPQLPISINLSMGQFHSDARLVDIIKSILAKTELSSRYLQFEMSEHVTILDIGSDAISKLKEMNIKLTLDDFGARYFSLHELKRYKIDNIKIDRSLISGIPFNTDKTAIVAALIAMGKKLNITAIAEGIETKEQLHFLQENDCFIVQGNYISPPLLAKDILPFVKKLSTNDIMSSNWISSST